MNDMIPLSTTTCSENSKNYVHEESHVKESSECDHGVYLWDDDTRDYYCEKCYTHFDQSAVNQVVKESFTARPSAQEQFPYRETCPRMSNYCDKHLRGYSIGSPWHGVIREAFSIEEQLAAANARAEEYASISRELAETSHVKEYSLIPRFIKAQAKLEALNQITL